MLDNEDEIDPLEEANEPETAKPSDGNAPETEYDLLKNPEIAARFKAYKDQIEKAKKANFIFLLVGRTGVGKSSSINSLLEKEVAPVGDWEPTTMKVEAYDSEMFGIKLTVIDTPGLCDDIEEAHKDYTYLKRMQEGAPEFDCLWFVTPLYETRIRADEKRAIKLIGQAFGQNVWKHTIIIFTFANSQPPNIPYKEAYEKRTMLIRHEIEQWCTPQIAAKVPSVAIDNKSKITPDEREWYGELYTTVIEHISDRGFLPFLLGTAPLIEPPQPVATSGQYFSDPSSTSAYSGGSYSGGSYSRHTLSDSQKERVGSRMRNFFSDHGTAVAGGVVAGAAIGALGGPIGAAIGGGVGAVVGGLLSFFGKKK